MTHSELVKIAEKWLIGTRRCSFVFTELDCVTISEIPDAIGFRDGESILVECKVSRADFLADNRKRFRQEPETGVGTYRLYLCPERVIMPEDLPGRWGLIWVNTQGKPRQVVGPKGNAWSYTGEEFKHGKNLAAEWGLMASALRRLHLRGVLPLIYDKPWEKKQAGKGSGEVVSIQMQDDSNTQDGECS